MIPKTKNVLVFLGLVLILGLLPVGNSNLIGDTLEVVTPTVEIISTGGDEAIKTTKIGLKQSYDDHEIHFSEKYITNGNQLLEYLKKAHKTKLLVIIGHGEPSGLVFDETILKWSSIVETLEIREYNPFPTIILACHSDNEESNDLENYFGLKGLIDAQAAWRIGLIRTLASFPSNITPETFETMLSSFVEDIKYFQKELTLPLAHYDYSRASGSRIIVAGFWTADIAYFTGRGFFTATEPGSGGCYYGTVLAQGDIDTFEGYYVELPCDVPLKYQRLPSNNPDTDLDPETYFKGKEDEVAPNVEPAPSQPDGANWLMDILIVVATVIAVVLIILLAILVAFVIGIILIKVAAAIAALSFAQAATFAVFLVTFIAVSNLRLAQEGYADPHDESQSLLIDGDGDGWNLRTELDAGTLDSAIDTDNDGINDPNEGEYGADPTVYDSDSDGLNDGSEVFTHDTFPYNPNTDSDYLDDGDEISLGFNPNDAYDPINPYNIWYNINFYNNYFSTKVATQGIATSISIYYKATIYPSWIYISGNWVLNNGKWNVGFATSSSSAFQSIHVKVHYYYQGVFIYSHTLTVTDSYNQDPPPPPCKGCIPS